MSFASFRFPTGPGFGSGCAVLFTEILAAVVLFALFLRRGLFGRSVNDSGGHPSVSIGFAVVVHVVGYVAAAAAVEQMRGQRSMNTMQRARGHKL